MRISVVTGASSGLGREIVKLIDKREMLDEIWVIARREERLKALQNEVNTKLRILPYDLTEKEAYSKFSKLLKDEKPQIMFLVNAAGFGKIGGYSDISPDENAKMIDLNCRAAVLVTQEAIPYMPPKSHIMEVCSTAAFQPFPFLSVYAASKAFLYRYSRALRLELLKKQVSVTAVCPYWIKNTEFIGTAQKTRNSSYVRSFPFASTKETVALWAYADAKAGFAVSTPGPVCLMHRIAAKFIPSEIMMWLWEGIRRL